MYQTDVERQNRSLVLGLGNEILRDESVGVHVVRELGKRRLSSLIDIQEGGTMGLRLLDLIDGYQKAVVVDAVKAGGPPGSIYRLAIDECLAKEGFLTIHDLDLPTVVKMARLTGACRLPSSIVIIGIEPKVTAEYGFELSPEVEAAVPKAIELVLKEIEEFKGA